MKETFLVWLIPGYIAVCSNHMIRPAKSSSGWDFIARIGVFSLIFYSISFYFFYNPIVNFTPQFFIKFLDSFKLDECLKHFPLAIIFSVLYFFLSKTRPMKKFIWFLAHIDPFTEFCNKALNEKGVYILLSMKNGKVYVGQLKGLTRDINESFRVLAIAIELSGYRNKENHKVIFDKNYGIYDIFSEQKILLVPFAEISTIRPFDFDLHKHFVDEKITLLGPQEEKNDKSIL